MWYTPPPPRLLSSRCHCTILLCLRTHNRLVQYSEAKSRQPRHTLTHSDTDSIALPYSLEWDQETRCCVMDRHNHGVFSCQYTSVKRVFIFQMHQYTVWQETWYRFSGYWLKNSFAGKVYYLLLLLTKRWCFLCTSPEGIWRTKYLPEPYYFKVVYIDDYFSFSGVQCPCHIWHLLINQRLPQKLLYLMSYRHGGGDHEKRDAKTDGWKSKGSRDQMVFMQRIKLCQSWTSLPGRCKHLAPNYNPLMRGIGPWYTRAKQINVSHSKHAKLGFGCNETLHPWRPTHNAARWRGSKWLSAWASKENNSHFNGLNKWILTF